MRVGSPGGRFTTWCAIAAYVLVASGLPLPWAAPAAHDPDAARRIAAKDRSQPFPCMDKPCGCASAEQCFTSCCCHSPAETLAWAEARGMSAAVLAARTRLGARPAAQESSCCSRAPRDDHDDADACCTAAADRKPVCRTAPQEPAAARPESPGADAEPIPPRRIVTLRAMLACGGILAAWCDAGAALPPPRPAMPPAPPPRIAPPLTDVDGDTTADPPDSPPPRAA